MKKKSNDGYRDDILEHLRYVTALPVALHQITNGLEAVKQALSRAADEIERLRKENKELRRGRK